MAQCKWEQAATILQRLVNCYPHSKEAEGAYYELGKLYFKLRDYDLSNKAFTKYAEVDTSGNHFEEIMNYKFCIAEAFRRGETCHLFGARHLPRWMSAECEAIEIYDEIISVMPGTQMAAKSLWGKGCLQLRGCQYKEAVETYQTLITAFPKDPLAIESYLMIATAYLRESQREANNNDLLAMAEVNLKRFEHSFPGECRIEIAQKMLRQMREFFAGAVLEIACFYERTCHDEAAVIYYRVVVRDFPETCCAGEAQKALNRLCPCPG